jgi:hypothetical protein
VLLVVVGTPVAEQALAGAVRRGEKKKPAATGERPTKSIVALRAASGEVLWRKSAPDIDALRSLTLAASGNRVFYADGNGTACVELTTGRPLWRHAAPAPLGQSSGTLVVHAGVVLVALAGKGKRGLTLTALAGDDHSRNNWVRGGCQYGILPCNGLIYAPTHVCGCYFEAMVRGFWALAPEGKKKDEGGGMEEEERLERGPAFDISNPKSQISEAGDWPTYRGDAARSGGTAAELPAALAPAWQTGIGGKLTAPVVAGGRVFVSSINEHRIVAVDAAEGRVLWSFTAGGRVEPLLDSKVTFIPKDRVDLLLGVQPLELDRWHARVEDPLWRDVLPPRVHVFRHEAERDSPLPAFDPQVKDRAEVLVEAVLPLRVRLQDRPVIAEVANLQKRREPRLGRQIVRIERAGQIQAHSWVDERRRRGGRGDLLHR